MLEGLLAPVRVVLQRSLADWLIVVATWLVVVCATTLVALGVLYGDAVAQTGLRQALADEPATATSIVVEMRAAADEVEAVEEAIEGQVARALAWTGGELIGVERSDSYALPTDPAAEEDVTNLAVFGAYAAIEEHAELVDGGWPEAAADPMQVALSASAADALGLAVGDTLELASQRSEDRAVPVAVAGIWRPMRVDDPYWAADPLELNGFTEASGFRTHGPFVAARDDLLARTLERSVAVEMRALPDFDRLRVDDVARMRADTAAIERRVGEALGDRAFFQVHTELDGILAATNRSLLVSRSGVVVMTIQFAVLAGYALLLVAGLLVDQRRVETALLRSRGAGIGHVVLFSFLEALILVVPAVIAAPWLARGVLELLNVAGPLADAGIRIDPQVGESAILAAAAAGLAAVLGLVLPALGAGRGLAAVRQTISRQGNRTIAQRLGLDLALVLLAGIGLWQLRTYGAPLTESVRGSVGLDPLLVAAPAIGLLAGAILALRIVPLAAELGERLLARRRGLVAPLGARQLSRRPLRYTRSALLLMLAAALGTFAGAYASTWTASQADQAAYRTGSDVRAVVSRFPDLPAWGIGSAYRAVDGVEAALPVVRDDLDVGEASGEVLAIDASDAPSLVTLRPDLAGEPLTDLMATLRPAEGVTGGIALEGDPSRLRVQVSTDLSAIPAREGEDGSAPLAAGYPGIATTLVLRDDDGLIQRVTMPRAAVRHDEQVLEVELVTEVGSRPAYPLELLAVELAIALPPEVVAAGSVSLTGVDAATGGAWTSVPVEPETWAFDSGSPIFGAGSVASTAVSSSYASLPTGPIPALAGSSLAQQSGLAVGDTIELGSFDTRRQYLITGIVDGFPTVDPGGPFLIADAATLVAADAAADRPTEPDEWWLATAEGAGPTVAEALRSDLYSTESVTAYDDLHRELLSDPVALGLIGALVLGALSAIAFAGIGFFVSATVSTRERLGEFALLQAIGLSHRQLSAWVSMENAFLLLVGLLVGTGLGLVLAWVVLPFVTLTQEATRAVPPVEVIVPWGAYALLYLAAGLALAVTVFVIGRLLARVRVSGVLRSGGE